MLIVDIRFRHVHLVCKLAAAPPRLARDRGLRGVEIHRVSAAGPASSTKLVPFLRLVLRSRHAQTEPRGGGCHEEVEGFAERQFQGDLAGTMASTRGPRDELAAAAASGSSGGIKPFCMPQSGPSFSVIVSAAVTYRRIGDVTPPSMKIRSKCPA